MLTNSLRLSSMTMYRSVIVTERLGEDIFRRLKYEIARVATFRNVVTVEHG